MVNIKNLIPELKDFFFKKEVFYKKEYGEYNGGCGDMYFLNKWIMEPKEIKEAKIEELLSLLDCDTIEKVKNNGKYPEFLKVITEISRSIMIVLENDISCPGGNYKITHFDNEGFKISLFEDIDKEEVQGSMYDLDIWGTKCQVEVFCNVNFKYPFEVVAD